MLAIVQHVQTPLQMSVHHTQQWMRSHSAQTTLFFALLLSNIVLSTVDQSRAAHRRLLDKKKECLMVSLCIRAFWKKVEKEVIGLGFLLTITNKDTWHRVLNIKCHAAGLQMDKCRLCILFTLHLRNVYMGTVKVSTLPVDLANYAMQTVKLLHIPLWPSTCGKHDLDLRIWAVVQIALNHVHVKTFVKCVWTLKADYLLQLFKCF